jgi:hypothetical protein
MIALEGHARLEAVGLWCEAPGASPREVIVSLGRSTLVLTDLAEQPLGHWALAGVSVAGAADGRTVYSMGGEETLAIRDRDMVAAIAALSRADTLPPRPGPPVRRRRRLPLAALVTLGLLALLGWFGPGLVRDQAVRMMPPERAAEFGDRMLIALVDAHGGTCDDPAGQRALGKIAARLAPGAPPRVRVLNLGAAPLAALPGGTLLVARSVVASADAPEALAGWIAVGLGRDPAAQLMHAAGPAAALGYVFTGRFADPALARAAAAAPAPPAAEEVPPAMARLAAAGVDARPFAAALGITGMTAPAAAEPLLAEADWAALRAICG